MSEIPFNQPAECLPAVSFTRQGIIKPEMAEYKVKSDDRP